MTELPTDPHAAALAAFEEAVEKAAAAAVLSSAQMLLEGGATPNQAFRLASFAFISESFGPQVLEQVGMSPATARRWRAEVRQFTKPEGGAQ